MSEEYLLENRYKTRKIMFGDECTKFFHVMAIMNFRRNTITQILNDSGASTQDHDGKACLLWNSFRDRLGITNGITMHFQLDALINPRDDLQVLIDPIEVEEIDSIVTKMPLDKAPDPDGFNGLFLK